MTTLGVFRLLYLGMVLVGLLVNGRAYQRSRWLYSELAANRINGSRLALANHFVREDALKVGVQFCLMVPAVTGLMLGNTTPMSSMVKNYMPWLVIAAFAHMAAVFGLMMKAIVNRRDQAVIMNIIAAEDKASQAKTA